MVSPLELKNKEFSTKLMGYNKAEVDDFLSVVIKDYEALYRFFRKNVDAGADVSPDEMEGPEQKYPEPRCTEQGHQDQRMPERRAAQAKVPDAFAEEAPHPQSVPQDRAVMEILEMARGAAEDARKAAASEAQSVIADAQRKAGALSAEADAKVRAAERRLQDLSAQEAAVRARMKGLIEVYRQLMEDFEATSGIDYNL